MKFSSFLTTLLCAEAAVAARHSEKRRASREARQISRRGGGTRQSRPKIAAVNTTGSEYADYSTNWAGAVLSSSGYTSVTGTVVVPSVSASGSTGAGSAWVGIDGDTCSTAILQTGFDWSVEDGEVSYEAWYEWYPQDSYDFSSFDISEGDSIKMTVTATSKTSGSAVLENLTTGKKASKTFSDVTDGDLCEYDAEWIVEDFEECSSSSSCSLVPFADFGTVEFTGCSAVKSGRTVGVSGATILDIKQSNKVLTSCSEGSSTVTCKYE